MTLFLSKAEQQASNFPQELTMQISDAHLAVAIIPESYVHVHLAFFDTTIERFIKQDDNKSCSF